MPTWHCCRLHSRPTTPSNAQSRLSSTRVQPVDVPRYARVPAYLLTSDTSDKTIGSRSHGWVPDITERQPMGKESRRELSNWGRSNDASQCSDDVIECSQ